MKNLSLSELKAMDFSGVYVAKESGKPFPDLNKVTRVLGVTEHPITLRPAFMVSLANGNVSCVEVRMCKLFSGILK